MTALSVRQPDICAYLENEVYPQLDAEKLYHHSAHAWKERSAERLKGGCPFHESKSGTAFVVDVPTLRWYCHGCGEGGGPIQYLARLRGFQDEVRGQLFITICQDLARMVGREIPEKTRTPEQKKRIEFLAQRRKVLQIVCDRCQEILWSDAGSSARQYLTEQRGLSDDEIRDLGLGLYGSVEEIETVIEKKHRPVAVRSGVLTEDLEGYILFPWYDEYGELLTLYGRYGAPQPPDGVRKTRGLVGEDSKRSPLYLDRALRAGIHDLTLVEGLFDAGLAQVRGDKSVIAAGSSELSRSQVATLKRCKIASVRICLDPDGAGEMGTVGCIKKLQAAGICSFVAPLLSDGQDPDDFISSRGIEAWKEHIANPIPGEKYRVQILAQQHRGNDDWTDTTIGTFLDESIKEGLQPEAIRLLARHFQALANQDPSAAVKKALETKSLLRVLALLAREDRADFELTFTNLREAGARLDELASLKRSINQLGKKLAKRGNKTASVTKRTDLSRVNPDLGAPVPRSLVLPLGITVDLDGVRLEGTKESGETYTEVIAPSPILISGRLKDTATGSESIVLTWFRDGKWQKEIVDRGSVADSRTIVRIAALGAPVTSLNARGMVDYLANLETANQSVLIPQRVTDHMGWHTVDDEPVFLLGKELITKDGEITPTKDLADVGGEDTQPIPLVFRGADAGDEQFITGFHRSGTFEEWQVGIKPLIRFPRIVAVLLGSLATPLLSIINAPSFILSLSDRTSRGKTTGLRIAGSVWGDTDETNPGSVVRSWDSTSVFVERVTALRNHLPLLLDETSLVKGRGPQRVVERVIYSFAGGQGRGRGSIKGLRTAGRWSSVLISTGEQPLTSLVPNAGGAHARVLEMAGPPFADDKQAELVNRLRNLVFSHYGHAGPGFVQFLLDHRTDWSGFRDAYHAAVQAAVEKAGKDPVAGRLAHIVAVLELTASLVGREGCGILPWGLGEMTDALQTVWDDVRDGADRADVARQALDTVLSWAFRNGESFWSPEISDDTRAPHRGWAGRWDRSPRWEFIAFASDKLEGLLESEGYPPTATIAAWNDRGWLKTSGTNRRRFQTRLCGEQIQSIAITRDAARELGFGGGPEEEQETIPFPEEEGEKC